MPYDCCRSPFRKTDRNEMCLVANTANECVYQEFLPSNRTQKIISFFVSIGFPPHGYGKKEWRIPQNKRQRRLGSEWRAGSDACRAAVTVIFGWKEEAVFFFLDAQKYKYILRWLRDIDSRVIRPILFLYIYTLNVI